MKNHIITAHDLKTGDVVFLDDVGDWVKDYHRAFKASDEEGKKNLLEQGQKGVAQNNIVDPYLVEIDASTPTHIRERIRVAGPTIHDNFKKVTFS